MFIDLRLPTGVERGVRGGSLFNTDILPLDSGREFRNINWQDARGKWDASYGVLAAQNDPDVDYDATLQETQAFFHIMRGRAHSFRFKDHKNYKIGDPDDPGSDHQNIALGDDTTQSFQLFKEWSYTGTIEVYQKPITKTVSGTESVYLDDVLQGAGYSIDATTGILTFSTAPGPGVVIAVACEFDHHVRFDTDHFDMELFHEDLASWPSIPLVELLEAD